MANRQRNIQLKIWVNEEERKLIEQKMSQLPTAQLGAYIRKMAIDGYIIYTDIKNIKQYIGELQAILIVFTRQSNHSRYEKKLFHDDSIEFALLGA